MNFRKLFFVSAFAAIMCISVSAFAFDYSTVVNPGAVNSSSFTSIGLTRTITPSSTAAKVEVDFDGSMKVERNGSSAEVIGEIALFRTVGGVETNITGNGATSAKRMGHYIGNGTGGHTHQGNMAIKVVDSPNTTSLVTYEIKVRRVTSGTEVTIAEDSAAVLAVREQ